MSLEIKRLVVKQLVNCLKLRETQFTSSCSNTLKILIPRVQSMLTNTLPTNKWRLKSSGMFSITTLADTILMQSHKGFLRPALLLRLSVTFPGKMWSLYWLVSCISGLSKATACVRTDCRILQLETVVNDRDILRQKIRRIHLGMRPTGNSTVWFGRK